MMSVDVYKRQVIILVYILLQNNGKIMLKVPSKINIFHLIKKSEGVARIKQITKWPPKNYNAEETLSTGFW